MSNGGWAYETNPGAYDNIVQRDMTVIVFFPKDERVVKSANNLKPMLNVETVVTLLSSLSCLEHRLRMMLA